MSYQYPWSVFLGRKKVLFECVDLCVDDLFDQI